MDEPKKVWRQAEVNLVKGALKERRAEDQRRADAWRATREAELEAVLGRSYDGMDVPGIPELLAKAQAAVAPYIEEYNRLFVGAYPAEFARATLRLQITAGGIPDPKFRERVRQDATRHLAARHRYMLANIAGHTTGTVVEASKRATNNPEVQEVLDRLAVPNASTPHLDPPGPAIGMLRRLLPHPEEWGFAGSEEANISPLLPSQGGGGANHKALSSPKKRGM